MTSNKNWKASKVINLILLLKAEIYFSGVMDKIVFSTNNPHKLEEVRQILKDKYEVVGLRDIGFAGDIPETGKTLHDNALIKSRFVHKAYGYDCFSDDTGLEIDALEGRPGVYSARYAGEDGNAGKNIDRVLREMKGVTSRTARFKTVISLILDKKEYFFEGVIEGKIATEKTGMEGFGYDPIFIPEGYDVSFAEMPPHEKNGISHRARAVKELAAFLKH
jgi:XTP/dITP diphosphohydrolase